MALKLASDKKVTFINVQFSNTLGRPYVDTAESRAQLEAVKAKIGQDPWKLGFTGDTGVTAQAVKELRAVKFPFVDSATGHLTSVKKQHTDKADYLKVTLASGEERIVFSLDASTDLAQKLVRKLAKCQPNVETEIRLFAIMDKQREGQTRAFANFNTVVKQNDTKIEGIARQDELKGLEDAALAKLKDAGVDDKETLNARRTKIAATYHEALLTQTTERFDAFYAARKAASAGSAADNDEVHGDVDEIDADYPDPDAEEIAA